MTFETHFRKVVPKAARSLGAMRRAEKVFDCPRVLKNFFSTYVLSNLEYCVPVWLSSAKFHLCLLDSIVRSVERLRESELCCLGHRRKEGKCLVLAL